MRSPELSRAPQIAIIGGGFGGIALGVKLKRAGIHTFKIFDAMSGPGGTWWRSHYPGAEVDVPSVLYAFSFNSYPWTRTHARQPELLDYVWQTIDEFDLRPHFNFDTRVKAVRWHEGSHRYSLETADGEQSDFDVVVSAVGLLSDPQIPMWEGLEEFQGHCFHAASWDHSVDLRGKRVAVVGTGATAAQLVPAIARDVEKLFVFQREPGWVIAKRSRDYTDAELRKYARRWYRRQRRVKLAAKAEWGHVGKEFFRVGSRRHRKGEAASRAVIESVFADREDLRKAVTPTYPFAGKRRIRTSDYYPTLLRENVELVPSAVERVTEHGVVDALGVERDIDVLILATGYNAASFLSSLQVVGRDGEELEAVWRDGAYAFLGITVQGFPNFYVLGGPNTVGGFGVTTMSLERQAEYVVRDVKRMIRHNYTSIEVKPAWVAGYNRWLERRLQGTAWLVANNSMKGRNGAVVTQWPESGLLYWLLIRTLRRPSSAARRATKRGVDREIRASETTDGGDVFASLSNWRDDDLTGSRP